MVAKILRRLQKLLGAARQIISCRIAGMYGNSRDAFQMDDRAVTELVKSLNVFTGGNKDITYSVESLGSAEGKGRFKWTGASADDEAAFLIPNSSNEILRVDDKGVIGRHAIRVCQDSGSFRWTGGCIYQGRLYCFPRSSNFLLEYDMSSGEIREIDLGQNYRGEHHYGGVLVPGGKVILPPRNTDHLLVVDLNSMKAHRVQLAPQYLNLRLRYCCSVLHPNGLVYFAPERHDRVLVFNPETEEFRRMGRSVNAMVFGMAFAPDGCLYGFSAVEKGILRIDTINETADMIRCDYGIPGCYGTKLGINGHLYGIPGKGTRFLEFCPEDHSITRLAYACSDNLVTCAGGSVRRDGVIVCAPCEEDKLLDLMPSTRRTIPDTLYELCFSDCY